MPNNIFKSSFKIKLIVLESVNINLNIDFKKQVFKFSSKMKQFYVIIYRW